MTCVTLSICRKCWPFMYFTGWNTFSVYISLLTCDWLNKSNTCNKLLGLCGFFTTLRGFLRSVLSIIFFCVYIIWFLHRQCMKEKCLSGRLWTSPNCSTESLQPHHWLCHHFPVCTNWALVAMHRFGQVTVTWLYSTNRIGAIDFWYCNL